MNCLMGTLQGDTCTYCHKKPEEITLRPANTLPARYMLGGQYYLGRVVGNGGFGITYLAWDCVKQRRVVVKELYPKQDVKRSLTDGRVFPIPGQEGFFEKCRQRFKEEAQVLYSFYNEPLIVDVYRLMEENHTVYYSMEYLSGFDLRTYVENKGTLVWEQLSCYVRKILAALCLLHGRNLIHRDISPDNIFLTSLEDAKLIDFGSVRTYNNGQGLTTILKHVFAPVEQYFTNGHQGPWTDLYALSVTMYYALSGKCPPKAPDRVRNDSTVPIENFCPELPEHVSRAIMRGMAVRAQDRFQNVQAMAAELFPGEFFSGSQKQAQEGFFVRCVSGLYQGRIFQILPGQSLDFGRHGQCGVSYPQDSPGISRRQCRLWCPKDNAEELFIQDENSSWGTAVSGCRLQPGKWYKLVRGNTICFAGEHYQVQ